MMQKRTLYLSFLLVSCLLFFGFSFASAQTVTFQSKGAVRCTDVILNITVQSPDDLFGLDIVFQVSGDYTSVTPAFEDFGALYNQIGPVDAGGGVYRMVALRDMIGDVCLDASGGVVVGTITLHTADVCNGTITVTGTTIPSTIPHVPDAVTKLIGCAPVVDLTTDVVAGTVTITNQPVSLTCPPEDTIYVHWGDKVEFDVTATDADLANSCEDLTFTLLSPPTPAGTITKTGDNTAKYEWWTGGPDVCNHTVRVQVEDKCGETATCDQVICVQNTPPVITHDPAEVLYTVWCIVLSDSVVANDPDGGPNSLQYSVDTFDGPTTFGNGLQLDANTGKWTWDIGNTPEYLGDFELCIVASDGANICDPCSPENADTACYKIHVTGFAITIEKVHKQLQGHYTTVSIYLDSTFMPDVFCCDLLGGFDFLIAYDASALTAISAEPGALIDNDKFEYFTYRFGANGNCGNACPSGLLRIVAMREENDGVVNPYHLTGPGELAKMNFYVTTDYNFGGQYVPILFFWGDCGDNTLSDETGNWLYLALEVYDHEWMLITDPVDFGYGGPMGYCFDTVYSIVNPTVIKNYPLGAIIFRGGGVDIIPPGEIDDRGDVNLNHIAYEIADAVVFTNYFIYGSSAFTINFEGQKAATEVNGDGIALTVADLVYLIRVIVGDAQPMPKINPNAFADFKVQGETISVETNVDLGAALFVFNGQVTPTLAPEASHMELRFDHVGNTTRALVYSTKAGDAISSGQVLHVDGEATLASVETAEYRGTTLKTNYEILPTNFVLHQNYPNPFNPATTIKMGLPHASDWSITIFNVAGQKVAEYSGHSEAGIVTVNWNAEGAASGLYFYKGQAGQYVAHKKMILLK
jgi:hypothetical protein